MDGTLRGADEERNEMGEPKNMLPKWKRGAFSMLFVADEEEEKGSEKAKQAKSVSLDETKSSRNTNEGSACLWYLDHEKREAVDMSDASGGDAQTDPRGGGRLDRRGPGRCGGEVGEIQGRYRGDAGEM